MSKILVEFMNYNKPTHYISSEYPYLEKSGRKDRFFFSKRMKTRYMLAIGLLCILSIINYLIAHRNIKCRGMDTFVMKLSDDQRVSSQRITMFFLNIAASFVGDERRKLRDELFTEIKSMEDTHDILIHGKNNAGKNFCLSQKLKDIYFSSPVYLDKKLHNYFEKAKILSNMPDTELTLNNPHMRYIVDSAYLDLINGLDIAVKQYEKESEAGMQRIQKIELSLLIINIFVLLIIALFIFFPLTRQIQYDVDILQKAKEFNEGIIKILPFGMEILDMEGNIIYLDEKLKSLFPKDAIGRKCYSVYKDNNEPCQNCPLKKGIEAGKTETLEVDGVLGGKIFRLSHTGMYYQGQKAVFVIFEDITEKKHLEEKLEEEEVLREEINIKSNFISMVSHELRTPLTAIKEGIAIVLDGSSGSVNDEQKEFLEIAEKNVNRLSRLINDVLDYQKLEAGRMEFDMREGDINEIVKDVERAMDTLAKNKGLDFLVELSEDLSKIVFDSDRITQVLMNIVNNAIKFTERGYIKITTAKDQSLDFVCVSVTDTGRGINKDDTAKLFHSFGQLEKGLERKTGGTGLGLAISEKIITQHGGKIWVESEYSKGSTFYFILPCRKA